ncbi:hypothetical protein C8R45DRAFT_921133 [Mycena sanguinolenta]|nr:hypothetical protein C8R45DRAFT_921133 [Mycena sanguinolenta]
MRSTFSPVFTTLVTLSVCAASPCTKYASILTLPPLNGKFDHHRRRNTPAADIAVVTRDNSASPVPEKCNICYIPGPCKYFLNTCTDTNHQALDTIINGWIDTCHLKGFNAIEPDNLDTFSCSNKLLTADNNLTLAKLFTDHAHLLDLVVTQKNTGGELDAKGKSTAGFDFAVVEVCQVNEECNTYTSVYGMNGHLRQEFGELELLNKIKRLAFKHKLPATVHGIYSCNLLQKYKLRKGSSANINPPHFHKALRFNDSLERIEEDLLYGKWEPAFEIKKMSTAKRKLTGQPD